MINQQAGYNYYPQEVTNQVQMPNVLPCYFVQSINEAYNWRVAPGNCLIFKDIDGVHIYTKSQGLPYEKPAFDIYTKEQAQVETQSNNSEFDSLKDEISKLKDAMRKLNNKIKAGDD